MEHQFLCAMQQNKYLSNSQYVIILARLRDLLKAHENGEFDLLMHTESNCSKKFETRWKNRFISNF